MWQEVIKTVLEKIGLKVCTTNPCIFTLVDGSMHLPVHVDDFLVIGTETDLEWLCGKLSEHWEIKSKIIGGKENPDGEITFLGR